MLGAATRRGALLLAALTAAGAVRAAAAGPRIEVWRDPGCGCCGAWARHMRQAGFEVVVHEVEDVAPVKRANGVPEALWSCHTAIVAGYVVEGHVPAADVRRLLAERPPARGLAVPGMPPSAPGMDIPGTPYDVLLFGGSGGGDRVFARH
ncbi:DUF411 domain-containing protein [Caldovatus sp. SYSU G05006]|uniref:DUF411 domain-containing protein n=2 Tax=Caldovatus aquaticus TaxID=2865671 RepID=A0ABS7F1J7_9PROT|nr:DUF411 domain-containing protein [Caldovatus aquaticus]MBW8269486.1 DUF411 domain-containing protein [Caldovatus aquaticus]